MKKILVSLLAVLLCGGISSAVSAAPKDAPQAKEKNNPFAGQQKKIEQAQSAVKKAKKKSDQRRAKAILEKEQDTLKAMLEKELKPLLMKEKQLKAKIGLTQSKKLKTNLEKEMEALQSGIKDLRTAAGVEKYAQAPVVGTQQQVTVPTDKPNKHGKRKKKSK